MSRTRHLMKRGNIWQYNRAYPLDLQETLGRAPFRKSLRTDSLAEALRAKADAEREYYSKVDAARASPQSGRKGAPNEAEAQALAIEWFRSSMVGMDEVLAYEQREQERLELALETAAEQLAIARRELTEEGGGYTAFKIAREEARCAGFETGGPRLARLIQRARIASGEVWQARLVSDYSVRPGDPLFAAALEAPQRPSEDVSDTKAGWTLGELIEAFRGAQFEEMKPAGQAGYRRAFMVLRETLGESRELANVDREDARRVFETVKAMPAGFGGQKRWEGIALPAAVETAKCEGLEKLSPKTINGTYMGLIAALFNWAVREGKAAANPFKGLRVKDDVAPQDKRDPFTQEQLKTLFAAPPWTPRDAAPGGRPIRYWMPLFALWQGMRRGEIAQLRVSAFREEEGVHLFEVQGNLKNANARRTLPLHHELKRLGILDYVAERRAAGETLLFDGARDKLGRWGNPTGRWFTRLIGSYKFEGRKLGLHSFRHNFEDALRRADLHGTEIGAALAGRKGGDPVAGGYGRGFNPNQLAEAIAKVNYPGLTKPPAARRK